VKIRRLLSRILCAGFGLLGLFLWLQQTVNQGDPLQSVGLVLCHDRPCFMGITPGQTTWTEVKTILTPGMDATLNADSFSINAHTFEALGDYVNPAVVTDPTLASAANTDSSGPNRIDIVPRDATSITLQMIVRQYGAPCGVSLFLRQCNTYIAIPENTKCRRFQLLMINYPGMRVDAILDPDDPSQPEITEISPNLPLYRIELFDPAGIPLESKTCTIRLSPDLIGSVNAPWMGFRSIQTYTLAATQTAAETSH